MRNSHLNFIKQLLDEHHIYEELPDKAVHKLSYLIYKKSREQDVDISIPYFWYRYGILTEQANTTQSGLPSPDLDNTEKEILTRVTGQVLEQYYESSLEEITDLTYRDAPYDVFQYWRELDKQLGELKDNYNPFFDNTPIREEIEDKVERVYDEFPTSEFPQHEPDVATWYFAMIRELDMGLQNIQRMNNLNTAFWGIFTLSVAERHHHNMSEEDVLRTLGIDSFEEEIENRRRELRKLENDALDERFDNKDSGLTEVTDAMVEPIIESQ